MNMGQAVLESFGMLYPHWWIWIDIGALIGMIIAWNGVAYLAMLFLGGACSPATKVLDEACSMTHWHADIPGSMLC